MVKRSVVAIIPARGGSKRIAKKNIIDFKGKPLIAWTIEAAQQSGLFDKVVVSTDAQDIADVAKQFGAEVPFLRKQHADDFSPVSEATIATLKQLHARGQDFDDVVQLFAVCPLRTAKDIQNAYAHYLEKNVPFQISCYRYTWMNPWWAVTLNDQGQPSWIFNSEKSRSQDLPPLFSPTGAIWIGRVNDLFREGTFYGQGHIFWEINWIHAVDIDNPEDLILAKVLSEID